MNFSLCKHLRTKKMYTLDSIEEALKEEHPGHGVSCHFWCNKTQTVVGADDSPVHKSLCQPHRRCFEE